MLTLAPSMAALSLPDALKRCGVVGCGGAGFPTYAKYASDGGAKPRFLVVNAQESEPGYFIDKWVHEHEADALLAVLGHLAAVALAPGGKVVVAAKLKDRDTLMPLEHKATAAGIPHKMLDCTGRNRHKLDEQSEPLLFAYTDDKYPFGMETALLLIVAQAKIPQGERPSQHGFVVNNSETLWNIHRALTTGAPVVEKFVHVYGATPRHTFRQVPVGTPATVVLADAGVSVDDIDARGLVVVDGGPGWFERVDPRTAVVARRTNSLLVLDPAVVDVTKKDVFDAPGKPGYPSAGTVFTKTPSPLSSTTVRVPLIDNPNLKVVVPAVAIVQKGDRVGVGDTIARAADHGVSVDCHASIAGVVVDVDAAGITIAA
jgi:electron transport complex protein RnfC